MHWLRPISLCVCGGGTCAHGGSLWSQPVLVMTTLGERMSDDEVDALLRAVDTNRNGVIEYEEFVEMMLNG